jgi:predicted GNAT superfamily acetyltransferase
VSAAGIEVRHCRRLEEFAECVRLQQDTWGQDIVVPSAIFVVAIETGGQVLGAFEGRRLVGFTMALAGIHGNKPFLHSHMTAVLPELRDRGIGRKLKLAQREDALSREIELVEWTFDPLELKNAYFNLVRLGAIVRRFIPNCYGITQSPLHGGLPTDRLLAEWWLDSERVRSILAGRKWLAGKSVARIGVPVHVGELKEKLRGEAAKVQEKLRAEFERLLGQGYVATGMERAGEFDNYVLEPASSLEGVFPHRSANA